MQDRHSSHLSSKAKNLNLILLLFFCVFVLRLWNLQIIKGEYFLDRSENNRRRKIYIPPPRGLIHDRNGAVLVKNRPSFYVELVKEDAENIHGTIQLLSELTGRSVDELKKRLKSSGKVKTGSQGIPIILDADFEELIKVKANQYRLRGIRIGALPVRYYLNEDLAAHILGYIREINAAQLLSPKFAGYRRSDLVGQYGVEAKLEDYLQGKRGEKGIIVNAKGSWVREEYYKQEKPGHKLFLTIDLKTQIAAEKALANRTGVVIALDPNTGGILALVSKPSFSPNLFARELSESQWNNLILSPEKPLTNRGVQGIYPPGSLFKVITAVAGLEEGIISNAEKINCPGYYSIGKSRRFKCHKEGGHGLVNMTEAIEKSCNVYFYTLGQRLGIDRIHRYASMFGFGEETGFDLMKEARGLVPSREWKKKAYSKPEDKRWYPGETPSVSIGQGALSVTPLQMVKAIAAFANGGFLVKPKIVNSIETSLGVKLKDETSVALESLPINQSSINEVVNGMYNVVNSEAGTGRRARIHPKYGYLVGKTGTAQKKSLNLEKKGERLAWFTGFAPKDNPQIVALALVESGEGGGFDSAPIVKEVVEAFLGRFDSPHDLVEKD